MKYILLMLFSGFSLLIYAQPIDWNNFSEVRMSDVMFIEMNEYVKRTHNGDSLVRSEVVQENIMSRNYKLIRDYHYLPLRSLHNQEWINDNANELPDTLKVKIIEEDANPRLLESIYLKDFDVYAGLHYVEILQCSSYQSVGNIKYQEVARNFIRSWNASPPHAAHMNANYSSKVLIGVATYYHRVSRRIFLSVVYVS